MRGCDDTISEILDKGLAYLFARSGGKLSTGDAANLGLRRLCGCSVQASPARRRPREPCSVDALVGLGLRSGLLVQ